MLSSVLFTGVTGALGSALLPALLRDFSGSRIFCLIRAESASEATSRLRAVVQDIGLDPHDIARMHALCADVSLPRFGLPDDVYCMLAADVGAIFHLAASVDFNATLLDSRRANVDSTRHLLDFARQCDALCRADFRLSYVSTAYVAGDRRDAIMESSLATGQCFWNSYEQSKFEAEMLIEAAKSEIPITVLRPSQIVGNSKTGQITKFFGFYEFVGLATRGRSNILVADPVVRPDMVPSDYVCEATLYLARCSDAVGKTYHLTAGLAQSITVATIVEAVLAVMAEHKQGLEVAARPKIIPAQRLELDASAAELERYNYSAQKLLMRTYQPYLAYERDFDVASTQKLLAAAGIVMPSMQEVIMITTDYALRSRTRQREKTIKYSAAH